jgi:hypothetical protein
MNVVKLEQHLKLLKEKHDLLDKKIKQEYNHHLDDIKLKEMKLKKLELKQEMFKIEKKIA